MYVCIVRVRLMCKVHHLHVFIHLHMYVYAWYMLVWYACRSARYLFDGRLNYTHVYVHMSLTCVCGVLMCMSRVLRQQLTVDWAVPDLLGSHSQQSINTVRLVSMPRRCCTPCPKGQATIFSFLSICFLLIREPLYHYFPANSQRMGSILDVCSARFFETRTDPVQWKRGSFVA